MPGSTVWNATKIDFNLRIARLGAPFWCHAASPRTCWVCRSHIEGVLQFGRLFSICPSEARRYGATSESARRDAC